MRTKLIPLLLLAGLAGLAVLPLRADDGRPLILPFDLTLGGVKAQVDEGNQLFASIGEPVKPDAVLKLEKPVPMLIVNAFPCQDDGTVDQAAPAAVIFAQNTDQVKLDATIDGKKLAPGSYLANVVAESKTSRIVFTIAKPGEGGKVDFSKIFKFLKKG